MAFIRVETEPCELELTDANALTLNSLQSAFPGSIGLTYKTDDGSKRALRFDGVAFHSPPEGWESVKSFQVHLSGRQSFPFDSYKNASEQFEKTVNTIQKLMQTGYTEFGYCTPPSPPSPTNNSRARLRSFRRRISDYRVTPEPSEYTEKFDKVEKTELDKQFSELTIISNGKDTIIEGLRKEIEKLQKENEELLRQSNHAQCKLDIHQWKTQSESLENELKLFREMSSKQENMGNKVKNLTNDIEELKNTSNTKIHSIQLEYDRVCEEMKELQKQHDMLVEIHSKTCHEFDRTQKDLDEVKHLLEQIKDRFAVSEKDYSEQLRVVNEFKERICNENIQLTQKLKDIENENKYLQSQAEDPNSFKNQQLFEIKEKYQALQEEHEGQVQETASLNSLIDNLNRHLTDITVKYKDLRTAQEDPQKSRYLM